MNSLKGFRCYTAGNMENSVGAVNWRNTVAARLKKLGIKTFDPHKKVFLNQLAEGRDFLMSMKSLMKEGHYQAVHDTMKGVIYRDLRMVDVSDFLIINLEPSLPTYGTIHEVVTGKEQHKPLLFRITDKEKFPLWLMGLANPKLIFSTWNELIGYLENINETPIEELDPKIWKVFSLQHR